MYSKNNNFEENSVTGINTGFFNKKYTPSAPTIKSAGNSNEQSKSSYRKIKLKPCGKRV